TQRVVVGDYNKVDITSGSPEINRLIENFNKMTEFLGRSEREVMEANQSLRKTLAQLDEHSRYTEVVLSQVTTGVISVNQDDMITMVNDHAAKLLEIDPDKYVGQKADTVLNRDYYKLFSELISSLKTQRAPIVQKEVQLTVKGRPLLLQMTISMLLD